jgi:putative hemolysin
MWGIQLSELLVAVGPALPVVISLLVLSAFFSGSEAAFFSLTAQHLADLQGNRRGELAVGQLLEQPSRLLTGVLFWNLLVNLAFFGVSSWLVTARLGPEAGSLAPWIVSAGSVLGMIAFGELLPKSLAVRHPLWFARRCSQPLQLAIRSIAPVLPFFETGMEVSRRLVWPRLTPETYLDHADLQRAISLTGQQAELIEQEQRILQNIVGLSQLRAEQWMHPRTRFQVYRWPAASGAASVPAIVAEPSPGGYVLLSVTHDNRPTHAIDWRRFRGLGGPIDQQAYRLAAVAWCTPLTKVLEKLRELGVPVAAVLDEYGETIGILTWDDMLEAMFATGQQMPGAQQAHGWFRQLDSNRWEMLGSMSLSRLERVVGRSLPVTTSLTLAGLMQRLLGRLPRPGDRCRWEEFELEVLEVPERGELRLQLVLAATGEGSE